jgi:hypothetical protein
MSIKGVIDMLEELSYTDTITTRSYQLPSLQPPGYPIQELLGHKDVCTLDPASSLCLIILDMPYFLQGAEYTCTSNKN